MKQLIITIEDCYSCPFGLMGRVPVPARIIHCNYPDMLVTDKKTDVLVLGSSSDIITNKGIVNPLCPLDDFESTGEAFKSLLVDFIGDKENNKN